jgi:glycosyltransferase involved in cell wall biosynthesis
MTLTIITINLNNASGLEKTMKSVLSQTCPEFEYVVVDGASTDGSTEIIRKYALLFKDRMKWISEPDKGIYNAMNKGIQLASGRYVEFLNSGDCLASDDIVERMYASLEKNGFPPVLYGNLLKEMPDGTLLRDKGFAGRDLTFLDFYQETLNHSPAFISKALFGTYGLYDESLRIVSDWKWFLEAIVFGHEKPVYTDMDVTVFDMHGISETNREQEKSERKRVLSGLVPASILADYDRWAPSIDRMKRLKRFPWADKLVWFVERCLFKVEKARIRFTHER